MFDSLTTRLTGIFDRLRGFGRLTEENIQEALREVRVALLEADVNFKVVKAFVERVRDKAQGQDVLKSLTPGQQVVKVVRDEVVELLGGSGHRLAMAPHPPTVIMLWACRDRARRRARPSSAVTSRSRGCTRSCPRRSSTAPRPSTSSRRWGPSSASPCSGTRRRSLWPSAARRGTRLHSGGCRR